jgi:predicted component of viral defense system (DUF524 family)
MEETVYNPHKGRFETIEVEYTEENTTWLENWETSEDIYRITDYKGGILIKECSYTYPVWIYDYTRADIGTVQEKAKNIKALWTE